MTTLILVRHGESVGNVMHTFCGHTDVPLTEHGRAQAECTAHYLDSYPIDVIYASDLRRTCETAEPTANRQHKPIIKDECLREIYAGAWEGIAFQTLLDQYPNAYDNWRKDIGTSRCTKGESVVEMQMRIDREIRRIVMENRGKTIAIFTHATPIRAMSCIWRGQPVAQMQTVSEFPSNASVTIVTFDDEDVANLVRYGENDFLLSLGYKNNDDA